MKTGVINMECREYKLYVNGDWYDGKNDDKTIERYNPSTGECVSKYLNGSSLDIDYASEIALRTLNSGSWSDLSRDEKSLLLMNVANRIEERIEELSKVESLETGKSLSDATNDIKNGIRYWRYASAIVRVEYGNFINNIGPNKGAYTIYDPVGVVALILPWNFPFIVMSERLPFMLAAGCTVVAKPSEYASGSCLILGEVLHEAGIPAGVYNVVTGNGCTVGEYLVENNNISMVSFTGSTKNGKSVMKAASKTLKMVSLELGGKSPIIVFSDCDLDKAADAVINGFTNNRDVAIQHCPALSVNPFITASAALSRSQSEKTIIGLFPPNSKLTIFKVLLAAFITDFPFLVDPVNETIEILLFSTRYSPTVHPLPVTTL
jgi:acyl-CoA reductase-like NAD-dependent aldehyde dehydrogenase